MRKAKLFLNEKKLNKHCITITRTFGKHCVWYTEALYSCLISRLYCDFPLVIESAITESWAESLPLSHSPKSQTSDPKLSSHVKYVANYPGVSCSYICTLTPPGPRLQWGRSRYTLLMRPYKTETTVHWFRMLHAVFARFSSHSNSIYNIIGLFKK